MTANFRVAVVRKAVSINGQNLGRWVVKVINVKNVGQWYRLIASLRVAVVQKAVSINGQKIKDLEE
jgi:hypothetical protein